MTHIGNNKFSIILGSAQFGMSYGISNFKGVVPKSDLLDLLKFSKNYGLTLIDTAPAYGDAEKVLGSLFSKSFDYITKIPPKPLGQTWSKWINRNAQASIKNLRVKKLNSLLIHNCSNLNQNDVLDILACFQDLISREVILQAGFSLNSIEEGFRIVDADMTNYQLVQIPCNIIDNRFEDSGLVEIFKKNNINIHVRSIFLQGLLLQSFDNLPTFFKKWFDLFNNISISVENNGMTMFEACINHIKQKKYIDGVVVGVTSLKELKEIISSFEHSVLVHLPNFSSDDNELVMPSKWVLE
jgi:aryl-alcohol dehydrogenase-like predicted oxidoreductase